MEQRKILIVDDDPNIREVLTVLLGSEGYIVEEAEDGDGAVRKVRTEDDINLIILDIMMPGISGIEACQKIREYSRVPILFLTAKSQDSDKMEAYTGGGDDYLVKPFSQAELLLKINSLLRRYMEYSENIKNKVPGDCKLTEGVVVNLRSRKVIKHGEEINLTDKEFDILEYFIENRGEVVENKNLYEGVWGEKYLPSAGNTIMVHVLNLRRKVEDDVNKPTIIKTVWGKGYRID